jgi:hypothetical protein
MLVFVLDVNFLTAVTAAKSSSMSVCLSANSDVGVTLLVSHSAIAKLITCLLYDKVLSVSYLDDYLDLP